MSDPTYGPEDYLQAELIVDHLLQNRAIQFQIEGESFSRTKMLKHLEERKSLLFTKQILLDECERILNPNSPT